MAFIYDMYDSFSQDVFIFDNGKECFVWLGGGASEIEKRNGLPYAHVSLKLIK